MRTAKLRHKNELVMGAVFAAMFIAFSLTGSNFFSPRTS